MERFNNCDKMEPVSDQNCFPDLRRLARNFDIGVNDVKSRIEEIDMGLGLDSGSDFFEYSNSTDETAALLFLQRSQKDIRDISLNVKNIHEDFKMQSCTLNSVNRMFACALESFKKKLENVESFIEKYGYIRPVTTMPNPASPSSVDERVESETNSENIDVNSLDLDDVCEFEVRKVVHEEVVSKSLDAEANGNGLSDPVTPKLEDKGLSEETMFKLKSGYFDSYGECTPQSKSSVRENDTGREYFKTKELSMGSSQSRGEISTPKIEAYGISEHTLRYLSKDIDDEIVRDKLQQTLLTSPQTPTFSSLSSGYAPKTNSTNTMTMKLEKIKTSESCFDLPRTPKLEGLSEHTLMFLNSSVVDKENVCFDSTPVFAAASDSTPVVAAASPLSPDSDKAVCYSHDLVGSSLPATPKFDLNLIGLSQNTLRFLNSKEENLF